MSCAENTVPVVDSSGPDEVYMYTLPVFADWISIIFLR